MNGMLKELNWIGKATKHKSDADVSITLGHRSNGKEIVSIIVRNEMFNLLSTTEYVLVAVLKNRIFFKEADQAEGILMYANANTKASRYMKFERPEMVEMFKPFLGDYSLRYDEFYELYYIEK